MSDKYIIKNCECKVKGKTTLCVRDIPYKKCENITDCKLKQIVELCKEESSIIQHKQRIKVKGLNKLADKIFELLDIQEVE